MTRSIRSVHALALLAAVGACRRPSELPAPGPEEHAAIVRAARAHIPEGPRPELVLRDPATAESKTLEVVEVGDVHVVRSRLYRVEARGVDTDGRSHPIRFYVVQTGPVFVVDTVVIPARRSPVFSP